MVGRVLIELLAIAIRVAAIPYQRTILFPDLRARMGAANAYLASAMDGVYKDIARSDKGLFAWRRALFDAEVCGNVLRFLVVR